VKLFLNAYQMMEQTYSFYSLKYLLQHRVITSSRLVDLKISSLHDTYFSDLELAFEVKWHVHHCKTGYDGPYETIGQIPDQRSWFIYVLKQLYLKRWFQVF